MHRTLAAVAVVALLIATSTTSTVARSGAAGAAPDIAAAVEQTLAAESAGIRVTASIDLPGVLLEPMQVVDVSGQVAFGSDLEGWFEGEALEIGAMSVIFDGDHLYLAADVLRDVLGNARYIHLDLTDLPPGFESLAESFSYGNDTSLALYWLLGVDGPPEVIAQDTVGGAETVHVSVPIDLGRAAETVPSHVRGMLQDNAAGLREAGADVERAEAWIDGDGLVRRVVYDMPVSSGDRTATMQLAYELYDHGLAVEFTPPPHEDVLDAWALVDGE